MNSSPPTILVTGANGFVGKAVCRMLLEKDFLVRAVVRSSEKSLGTPFEKGGRELQASGGIFLTEAKDPFAQNPPDLQKDASRPPFSKGVSYESIAIGDLNSSVDWSAVLENVDTVIHLAARVHVMQETATDPLTLYRQINVIATEQLAQAAVKAGVRRFIYLSSIKVNGEMTLPGQSFSEHDPANPQDAYSQSKWEAEQCLMSIAKNSNLEVVIIRPPLIYGIGVAANFLKLIQLVRKGWPLPLGAVHNQRSLIYLENLTDIILQCINSEKTVNQTYLVSDGDPVTTPELIRYIAAVLKVPARLIPASPTLLKLFGKLVGKQAAIQRLLGSLVIDNRKICTDLNWQASYTLQQALQRDFS